MDLPVRKKVISHDPTVWVGKGSWSFITINCVPPDKNQICRTDTGDAVLGAMKFNYTGHLHAIIAFQREQGMQMSIKNWKKFVAKKYGVAWQRDFFDHRLRDHHEWKKRLERFHKRCSHRPVADSSSVPIHSRGDGPQGRGYSSAMAATVFI